MSGTFLAVQWLRLHASTEGVTGSIPGWGSKIPQAVQCGQKKKERKYVKREVRINRTVYLFSLLTEHRGPLVSTTLSVRMVKKKKSVSFVNHIASISPYSPQSMKILIYIEMLKWIPKTLVFIQIKLLKNVA